MIQEDHLPLDRYLCPGSLGTVQRQGLDENSPILQGGTTVPWRTHTGPSLRVAPLSRTTMTWLGAVSTKHPWRTAWEKVEEEVRGQGNGSPPPQARAGGRHGVALLLVPSKQR